MGSPLPILGWREWAALPDLGLPRLKAKLDTGARSSALHAVKITPFDQAGQTYLRFLVHPQQRSKTQVVETIAPLLAYRQVKSSNGHQETRPVILTQVQVGQWCWPMELTLTNRDPMGFRLLLGRQALRRRFLVNPGHSFLHDDPRDVKNPSHLPLH